VRAVAFPDPNFVLSASRDATVRLWKHTAPSVFDDSLISHGSAFVNSLAYVPPSKRYPDGLIVSGGKDTIIEARQPGRASQDNAEALLLGHSSNVCALDVSDDGRFIISGSWDADARVWQLGQWDSSTVLQGHGGSVWAVLAYDKDKILTGCADKLIRLFDTSGKLLHTIRGSSDVVRALCRLPSGSAAQFASAGNDAIIRLWTLDGLEVSQLHGHENFIYALALLPDGNLVSSSEDRTVRIWQGNQCVQTITHPAISVWTVAVCQANGDIVTGASDKMVRVFTRAKERQADEATVKEFEESVKASSIPKQQVGDVNTENLPGPEFLTRKSGTKEGQVQMVKEYNGTVSAYQWSTAAQQWLNVGTVVDSAGSSGRKITYNGKDYDYVFDVDIEDGKPPLKLPYNLSQNPYETARKFIEDNELPISYLDQVTNFIVTNTQGQTIGQGSQSGGYNTWGTGSRYVPGEVDAPSQQAQQQQAATPTRPKILPQTEYLSIMTANVPKIHEKILEFNKGLVADGSKHLSFNPSDETTLAALIRQLSSAPANNKPAITEGIDLVVKASTEWPLDKRLPALDLLRLVAGASSTTLVSHTTSASGSDIVGALVESDVFNTTAPPNNTMMALRILINLFSSEEGRFTLSNSFMALRSSLAPVLTNPALKTNRNLAVAIATLYINFAVSLLETAKASAGEAGADRGLALLEDIAQLLGKGLVGDAEAIYRALVALGTVLSTGVEEVKEAAVAVFEVQKLVKDAEGRAKEPRVKNVAGEIRELIT
jgi:phospholipase A-2-activating protein